MARQKQPSQPSTLSQERVYDSSDEGEISDAAKGPIPKHSSKTKPSKKLDGTKDSGTSFKTKPHASKTTLQSATSSSEDVEESDKEEDNDAGSDDASTTTSVASQESPSHDKPVETPRKKIKSNNVETTRIATKPYKPPVGFEPMMLSASDYASDLAFLSEDLSGKQVWHISVPDSISIESIHELDIQAAMKGEPILSCDSVAYSMHATPSRGNMILLPQGTDGQYKPSRATIERNFHLQQIPKKTTLSGEQAGPIFTAKEAGKPKVVREQPEGLKMRYVPFGAPSIKKPTQDEEMKDVFQTPAPVEEMAEKPASRTTGRISVANSLASPEKEKKKKKKRRLLVDE